ncbi:GFA family protein [Lusitaniella coriacea]|uniref:GFA family protein n=1 Tax=Lusitaniella coriacea TaxID=1983105 RepID=UPI003CF27FE3
MLRRATLSIEIEQKIMVTGRCLCGAIEYQVELIPGQVYSCHCTLCQRAHGTAFATQALAVGDTLNFIKGEDKLTDYFSGGGYRAFCSVCGSRLMNYAEDKSQYVSVAVGGIEDNDQICPVANVCVESQRSWATEVKNIPSYEGIPKEVAE